MHNRSFLNSHIAVQSKESIGIDEPHFAKYLVSTADKLNPVFEWQMALVVMLVMGAVLAARIPKSNFVEHVPPLWSWRFGPSYTWRYLGAFMSGFVLLFGARLAGGCTSGHGISGGLQLALSSWTFIITMFAAKSVKLIDSSLRRCLAPPPLPPG